jgi:4-amino-4-deoxy-L-arabinose transferase-like glycosyltransferase
MSKKQAKPKDTRVGRRELEESARRSFSLAALDRWLAPRERWVLGGLLALALLVRVVYFVDAGRSPAAVMHEWDESDMRFFDLWAGEITAGDPLTNQSLHPDHSWHREVAGQYLSDHPEEAATLAPGGNPAEAARELWSQWYGGKRFHQEPLYPYLIGLTYSVFGRDVRGVFGWQAVLGVLTVLLVYAVTRRLFGRPAATVAGLLAVLCGPALYYDMVLLRTTPIAFMGLVLVYSTILALSRSGWRWWLVTGMAFGIALLLKTTFVFVWIGVLGLVVYLHRRMPRTLLRYGVALVGGTLLCLLPAVARNIQVGVSPLALSSVGSVTFVQGNTVGYRGDMGAQLNNPYLPRIMGESEGEFWPAVVATLKTHSDALSYLRLLWQKTSTLWHWFEQPNNLNYYFYRQHSGALRLLPVTFLVIAPLALVGLVLAWPGFKASTSALPRPGLFLMPLYFLVLGNVATLLISLVLARYRLPLVVALIPFAAVAVVRIVFWLLEKDWTTGVTATAAVVLVFLWTGRPLPGNSELTRPTDHTVSYFMYFDPLIQQAESAGDLDRIVGLLGRALTYEPEFLEQLGPGRPIRTSFETQMADLYGQLHLRYAQALQNSGSDDMSAIHHQRGQELMQAKGN